VDPSNSFAYASGLTPRAARVVLGDRSQARHDAGAESIYVVTGELAEPTAYPIY
jgi:hypothetical protein